MVWSLDERLRADLAEAHKDKAGLLCRRTNMLWVKLTRNFR